MSSRPRVGQVARRDVAGMRAAADHVGRAHQHRQARLVRRLGGVDGGRELGDRHAIGDRFLDMLRGGVVVARQRAGRARGASATMALRFGAQ